MAVIASETKQSVSLRADAFKLLFIILTDCFTLFAMTTIYSFLVACLQPHQLPLHLLQRLHRLRGNRHIGINQNIKN
jgi:hypothetical protein